MLPTTVTASGVLVDGFCALFCHMFTRTFDTSGRVSTVRGAVSEVLAIKTLRGAFLYENLNEDFCVE